MADNARYHGLDALRAAMMLLGLVLHVATSFIAARRALEDALPLAFAKLAPRIGREEEAAGRLERTLADARGGGLLRLVCGRRRCLSAHGRRGRDRHHNATYCGSKRSHVRYGSTDRS